MVKKHLSDRTYEEVCRLEAEIETLATSLRCQLEELAEIVSKLDDEYITPLGDEVDDYELQDWADAVNEIEQTFFKMED